MNKIFEDENILVTDTEASGLIIRHKKHTLQIMVTMGDDFIRASTHSNWRVLEQTEMISSLMVRGGEK